MHSFANPAAVDPPPYSPSLSAPPPYAPCSYHEPGIRKFKFKIGSPQDKVAHFLVHAWLFERPSPEGPFQPIGAQLKLEYATSFHGLSRERIETIPKSSDTKDIHSPWREQVHYGWNHVFYDVGQFMHLRYGTNCFMPPNTTIFTVDFPTAHENTNRVGAPAAPILFTEETLLAPAYLAPGVSLRVELMKPGQVYEEPTYPMVFDEKNRYTVWHMDKDFQLRFHVEGKWDESRDGPAAVMVYGPLLLDEPNLCGGCAHDRLASHSASIIEYV